MPNESVDVSDMTESERDEADERDRSTRDASFSLSLICRELMLGIIRFLGIGIGDFRRLLLTGIDDDGVG